jgi:hypothetical protein
MTVQPIPLYLVSSNARATNLADVQTNVLRRHAKQPTNVGPGISPRRDYAWERLLPDR